MLRTGDSASASDLPTEPVREPPAESSLRDLRPQDRASLLTQTRELRASIAVLRAMARQTTAAR